jgi:hypothetical protein
VDEFSQRRHLGEPRHDVRGRAVRCGSRAVEA